MKNKFLLLIWLLAVPLLWGGCDKPLFKPDRGSFAQPDELPPITTTGEGTFACKINGVNWQTCKSGWIGSSISGNWSPNYKIFQLAAGRECEGFDDRISISAYIDSEGTYPLSRATHNDFELECQDVADQYFLLNNADNWVEILNLDTKEFIVSGTFQCTLVHEECGDTLFITDGRFDYDWAN